MTNLLAIETSGAVCSVCLSVNGNRFAISEHAERAHNELLLPMLSELRRQAGLDEAEFIRELDAVAFGRGPGSFTGVRIAAAAAQAIALASSALVVRVSSSEALARGMLEKCEQTPGVITFIRSRRDLYYVAAYRNSDQWPVCVIPDSLKDDSTPEDWYESYQSWVVAGETPQWWRGKAAKASVTDAREIHAIAQNLLAQGEGVDAAMALPEYLAGDSPWQKHR
jgi:tRNA threonylcarbamoyladenosine biosynthesis protein TsaB